MSPGRTDGEAAAAKVRETIVVFRVGARADAVADSLESVLEHTAREIRIVVVAGGPDRDLVRRVIVTLELATPDRLQLSEVTDPTELADDLAPADLAIVDIPCRVSAGWLDGLRAATGAGAEAAVALALDISNALPDFPGGPISHLGPPARRPRMAVAAGPCRFVRRAAIELTGAADLGAELVARIQKAGLSCVLAGDVLVSGARTPGPVAGEPALTRAVAAARRDHTGLHVIIDARCLDGPADGTRTHVLGLLTALARVRSLHVEALVPDRLNPETAAALGSAPGLALTSVPASAPLPEGLRADVVHRPFQVAADADLAALGRIADRLVVTHQDLISYHQRGYFASEAAWRGYREMTRRALRAADHVAFFSAHVRDEALAEELVESQRASVTLLGVDGGAMEPASRLSPGPASCSGLSPDAEMILCLGSDYWHKNRRFALRIVQALQRQHDWQGRLVLAGPRMRWGSSRDAETEDLAADPRLRAAVLDVGEVSAADRTWLLERSTLVAYPTVHEGFGLVPFEAASYDRPCLWAAGSALAEVLPAAAAEIVPWDAAATADAALALMHDPARRGANVAAVRTAAEALTWERVARGFAELYERVCAAPPAPAAQLERERGLASASLSDDAIRLVGPGGALPPDVERPLLALATHQGLARPLFAVMRAAYRLGHDLGRRRTRRPSGGRR